MIVIETGIKAVDVLAPLVRGGTSALIARPGMGQFVLLAELFCRTKTRGYKSILWVPETISSGVQDALGEATAVCHTLKSVLETVQLWGKECDLLLGVKSTFYLSEDLLALKEEIRSFGPHSVTYLLIDGSGVAFEETQPFGELDSEVYFDSDLLTRHLYPAIDPIKSTTSLCTSGSLEAYHLKIQNEVKNVMRRYRELRALTSAVTDPQFTKEEQEIYKKGTQLEAFFAQPFFVAEAYTKKPGEWLSLNDSLAELRRILSN